ncbi:MAG: ATP synthase F0 subunit B [Deltaproteobacteria bacterium]|nr:ATP synthase F0 subunit B [Deltaproteobacteria bacterium]
MIDLNATMLIQWGIIVALMVFLHYFLFKPVLRVIDARQAKVEGTFAGAQEIRQKADQNRMTYQERIEKAKAEMIDRAAVIRDGAVRESRELLEKAREEALNQVEAARERVRHEREDVRRKLAQDVDSLARSIAGKILERDI